MDINATLIIQMLVFAVFVWFTMRFVWPPLSKAMEERQNKIADGLSAAERGHKELELAQHRVKDELKQAKVQASQILDKANRRAAELVEEAKEEAKLEAKRHMQIAREELSQEVNAAKDTLRKDVSMLAITGAELILQREIDAKTNSQLLDNLMKEI